MSEPRIVDAVEVSRPDHWIGVSVSHGTAHLWSNIPRKSSEELMEGVKQFGESPQFIVRLPGTAAPAPATATDGVAELKDYSRIILESHEDGGWVCTIEDPRGQPIVSLLGDTYQAAAAACLAKIRGGK